MTSHYSRDTRNTTDPEEPTHPAVLKENASDSSAPVPDERTSDLLRRILAEISGDQLVIGHLVRRLHRRSFGGLLIMFGTIGLVPGVSTFAGLAMLIPGIQMFLGYRAPLLPRFIRRRTISPDKLRTLGEKALPFLMKIEWFVKPRWLAMTQVPFPNLIGMLIAGLALVVMLPLPFSNAPPALAIVSLSLGLMERDGLFISIGILLSLIALAIGGIMVTVALKTFIFVM